MMFFSYTLIMNRYYKITIIVTFIVSVITFNIVEASNKSLPLEGKIIYIDAGHGGRDPGTMYGNILEKDLNLEIAQVLEGYLLQQGAIVYQIREEDMDLNTEWDTSLKRSDLYRRILKIEEANSDLYLSIHINWYKDPYFSGGEVLYSPINSSNKLLAESIMKYFKEDLNSERRIKETDLYMYNHTQVPGVLIECGFLSNYTERQLLQTIEYQSVLSTIITKGVITYFEEQEKNPCLNKDFISYFCDLS